MSEMEKAYKKINFVNKRKPALNQTNLNVISTAIDTIDDRVLELDQNIDFVKNTTVAGIRYIPETNQLYYWEGDGDAVYIDLPTPVIHGQIDSGIVSDSLVQYDITADDTVLAVFNKLPQITFAMINSNAQGNNYAYSLPNANSKGCTLFFKYYNNRGWLEFHSYDDPGNVHHAKVLDGQISGWVCDNILAGATMLPDATLIFPSGSDARKLEVTPAEIKFLLPANGFAGGMGYFKDGQRVGEIGYSNIQGGYYYVGESYDKPNGKLKLGSLVVQEAITAPAFNGNATSATSATQAEAARMLSGWPDNRNVNTKPNDYNNKFLPVGIKQNTVIGITDGGLYSAVFGMRGWGDTSGGKAHEIAFTANGKVYHRAGDTDTWGAWREIAHVDDLGTGGASDATTKVSKSGDTMTGNLEFSDSGTGYRGIKGACGSNDAWRVMGGATGTNAGFLELATADDGSEPVHVRQYTGNFTTLLRTLTLLNEAGNTVIPGQLQRSGQSRNWTAGRDGALIRTLSFAADYIPLASVKTSNGSWEIGAFNNNTLCFTYVTDADYNTGTNRATAQIRMTPDGIIHGKAESDGNGNNIVNTYATKTEVAVQFVGMQQVDAWEAAKTIVFPDCSGAYNDYLLVASGCSSTADSTGNDDYGRIIYLTFNGGSGDNIWVTSNLGSFYSGSTARFSVDKAEANITIKVPKGSYTSVQLYKIKNR